MEERFPTGSFPFRFFTTVLGIIFVNTHRLHIGTNLGLGNTTYKEHLSELFFDLSCTTRSMPTRRPPPASAPARPHRRRPSPDSASMASPARLRLGARLA